MTSRQLRKQRRAAARKQRKLECRDTTAAALYPAAPLSALTDPDLDGFGINPELLDEFTPEMLAEANRMRARVYARAGLAKDAPGHPTGPRTQHGKLVSSRNAFKHGLASGELIVPGECRDHFESLLEKLT